MFHNRANPAYLLQLFCPLSVSFLTFSFERFLVPFIQPSQSHKSALSFFNFSCTWNNPHLFSITYKTLPNFYSHVSSSFTSIFKTFIEENVWFFIAHKVHQPQQNDLKNFFYMLFFHTKLETNYHKNCNKSIHTSTFSTKSCLAFCTLSSCKISKSFTRLRVANIRHLLQAFFFLCTSEFMQPWSINKLSIFPIYFRIHTSSRGKEIYFSIYPTKNLPLWILTSFLS